MQRDVKIGIAIGVLLIALIAIFWWARSDVQTPVISPEDEDMRAALPDPVEPVAPVGIDSSPYLPSSPEVVGTPVTEPTAPPTATLGPGAAPPARLAPPVAPIPPVAPRPTRARFHTVKKGETLSAIAKIYYNKAAKWTVIRDANRDKVPNPNKLRVGTRLVIPGLAESPRGMVPVAIPAAPTPTAGRRTHTVAPGETLSTIARKYYGAESKWRLIHRANRTRVPDPNRLKRGMVLVIPPDSN